MAFLIISVGESIVALLHEELIIFTGCSCLVILILVPKFTYKQSGHKSRHKVVCEMFYDPQGS